jgi:uncharacterized protein (TIGR02646 family)
MIRLISKNPKATSINHLASVQQAILNEPTFEAQAKKASSRWDSKTSTRAAKEAFADIKKTLIEMCVGVEICVYCEQNEATDIEHIFPKKLYPEKAFSWDNYVLACGKCNTHHKADNFSVFNPRNSTDELDVKPARGTYQPPPTDDALFLNQRNEDPMDFFELNLTLQQFIYTPKHPAGTRNRLKAEYTIKLLGLNSRASLVRARQNATKYFRDRLGKYVDAINSTNFAELKAAIDDDFGGINETLDFNTEKERIKQSIKEDVQTYSHPSVWKELVRQRANLPRINALLNAAPEAVDWIP